MTGNPFIDFGPAASAVATGVIALLTFLSLRHSRRALRIASRQLRHMEGEAALDRHPHLFFKDLTLAPVAASGDAYPRLRLETKGVANLGRFSATVYSVILLDDEGHQLASAWPLRIIQAGSACYDFGRGPNETLAISRTSGGMSEDDPHPKLRVTLSRLADLAASLRVEFAYGGDPTRLWAVEIPRFDPTWAKPQNLYFDSTNSHSAMTRMRARPMAEAPRD